MYFWVRPSGNLLNKVVFSSTRCYTICINALNNCENLNYNLSLFLSNVVQWGNMGDEKKKETKIEKKDEFGNTVEKTEIEEKEEDDD